MILTDIVLARRLERAEAQSNVDFVEARARVFPDSRCHMGGRRRRICDVRRRLPRR